MSVLGLALALVSGVLILGLVIARFVGGPGCKGCGMTAGQCAEAQAHGYVACCPDCDHRG